ncbi:hypothetical protein C2E23DRAFT_824605 [Lenzites betulinus]|nr:hypothetical protein C2E23DRAFT_824605 [Lenzites betulinus]
MSAQSKFTAHRKAHNRTQKLKHNAFSTSSIKKIHLSGRLASTVLGPHYTDPYPMVQHLIAATATQPLSTAPHAPPPVYGNPLEPFSAAYVTWGAPEVPTAQNTTTSIPWPAGNSPADASYPTWDIPGAELQHNQTKNRDNSRVAHSVHLEDGPISACLGSSNAHGHDAYIQPHPITLQSSGIHTVARDSQGGQQFRRNEYPCPAAGTVMQEETWRYPHQRFPETGTYTYHWVDQRARAMAGMSPEYETPAETWRPTNMLTNGQLGWAATATQPSQPNVAGADGLDPARWSKEVVANYLGLDSATAGGHEGLSTFSPAVFDDSLAYAKPSYGRFRELVYYAEHDLTVLCGFFVPLANVVLW